MFGFILLFLALSLFPFSSPWVCHFSFVSLTLIFVLSPVSDSIHHLCCGLPVKVTGTGWKDEENKRAERWPHGVTERPGISPLSPPPPPLSSSLQLHMHTLSASLFLPYPCQYFSLSLFVWSFMMHLKGRVTAVKHWASNDPWIRCWKRVWVPFKCHV